MPRTMYDSIEPGAIPSTAKVVAGYVDGTWGPNWRANGASYGWDDAAWQRFRNAALVRITVTGGTLDADVADVESGDLTPAQGAEWVREKSVRGQTPYLYFSLSRLGEVQAALSALGLDPYHSYGAWIADWDGVATLPAGWLAKQYANPTLSGAHYDLSTVADYLPGIDPAPPAATPSSPGAGAAPSTAPPSGPPLDQARAAWAQLGDLLENALPGFLGRVAAAVAELKRLA